MHDDKFKSDLRILKDRIVAARGWISGFGSSERETIIAQTVSAAVVNLDQQGEPFSILAGDVERGEAVSGTDNGGALRSLLHDGYFTQEVRNIDGTERRVIFPSRVLLDRLLAYFKV